MAKVYVFRSTMKGGCTAASDIDVLIVLGGKVSLQEVVVKLRGAAYKVYLAGLIGPDSTTVSNNGGRTFSFRLVFKSFL